MKEKLLNSYLYVFDNEPYKITTEANGIYIQEEFVKGFAYINPSLANKMIPINYYVIKANTPEWYSYMVSTEPQPAPLGPDSSLPDNPELIVDGDNITVSEYGNNFKLFDNPNNIQGVIYNSTNENVAYFSSEEEGQVEIAGPGTTVLSQEFAGDDEYLPFSKSYNLEVEDITVDPEIAWSQNSATVQIGESNSFPTISNPHNVGLTFASSDESVATVNQETGEVSLVAAGNCSIACISIQDADYYSSTVEYSLTVLAAKVNPNLSWSFSPCTAQIGEQNNMPVLINPDNLEVVISSSDTQVAVIDQSDNEVLLHAPGTCYITASFAGNAQYNAYTISYELTVLAAKVNPDLHYSKDTGEFDLYTQGTDNIPFLYNSYNVSPITYSSSDTSVATVNSDGTFIPLAVGTTTITASFAGNSQYLASSDSYVLTISDSRPLEDNISFAEEELDPQFFRPLMIHLNNPDNIDFRVSTNETGQYRYVYAQKVDNWTIKVINGYQGLSNNHDNIDIQVVSQGSNPKTMIKSLTFGPYKCNAQLIQFNITGANIDSMNHWQKDNALSSANGDWLIYNRLNNSTDMYYESSDYGATWQGRTLYIEYNFGAYDANGMIPVIIQSLFKQPNGEISLGGDVQNGYVENTQIYIKFKSNRFTIVNGDNLGGGVLSGSYQVPKEHLIPELYDEMNQSIINSISIDGSDSMSLPSYDRYQIKYTDYTGNLANELNINDMLVSSPDPNCNITLRSKQVIGNDIFINLGIDSTTNVNGTVQVRTPALTHFYPSNKQFNLTITGIKPAITLLTKGVPTDITPGQTVNCLWEFEVPYGFRWDGEYYTEANAWISGSGQKYSPGSPTPAFNYTDDQVNNRTIMEVTLSATLDSSAPVGGSAYINFELNMSRTYADYKDRTNQTIVSATPSSKTVSVLSNEFAITGEGQTTSQRFKIGNFGYGYNLKSADLSITYTTNSAASISISNVSISKRSEYATITFDLVVGTGVAANDTVSIFAELTNSGDGYSMANTNVGLITLIPNGTTIDPDIYFNNSELNLDYTTDKSKLNGNTKTQALSGDNKGDTSYITWSTSDSSIATVQGNGYVIAHGNGTVNITAQYAANGFYNSKTVQYQLTIVNYKQNSTGQWYNDGNIISYLNVTKGGSNTYNLTFSGTPSDSWTFNILTSETINGISVDSTTGTITINESQLNTAPGSVAVEARRPADTSYFEGSAIMQIDIKSLP